MPTWDQVRALRLARSRLGERAGPRSLVRTVGEVCGVHAQVHSSAELQVWARVRGATLRRTNDALWKGRTLVRSWLMRGTLHWLPSADLPVYVAALRTQDRWWKGAWLRYVGLTADELRALLDAIRDSLDGDPVTREELAARVSRRVRRTGVRSLLSGWGELLKPASFHGYLCSGPPRGQHVTFVRPDAWLGSWEEHDEEAALAEVVRRYLRAYGPASREDFARWWGVQPAPGGRALDLIADETDEVEVEGYRGRMLAADARRLEAAEPEPSSRLLGGFDPYVIAFRPREQLVAPEHQAKVFRQAGWVSPTLLVDGRVAGVWSYDRAAGRIDVTVEPFGRLGAGVRAALREEAELLEGFLGAPVGLSMA